MAAVDAPLVHFPHSLPNKQTPRCGPLQNLPMPTMEDEHKTISLNAKTLLDFVSTRRSSARITLQEEARVLGEAALRQD